MALSESGTSTQGQRPEERARRRKRSGRVSLLAKPSIQPRRYLPTLEVLNEEQLVRLEQQADWILATVGVEMRGDETALALFRAAGADVEGERVRFEPGLVRHLCSTAPSTFQLHGRDPARTVTLGGDHLVLMPGYGSPFVSDRAQGRRYARLEDFENFVKLTFMSPVLHHGSGTVVEPVDVPVNKRHLDMVYAHLRYSTKPFMGSVTSVERARDSLAMAALVFGGPFMAENAVIQANINVNSPMVYDDTMSSVLRVYAEAGQCVAVSPAIFAGAMGPVTPAAVAAQTLAETMVGIALAQLVRPGTPCVFGSFHSTMSLKSGALTFGTPEANLVTLALGQLGRRLGVPVRAGGGQITAANSADGQAMQDSADALWSALLAGSNQVWHAAGWLEGGLTMSYEKFVMDLDHCGMMLRLLEGLRVDEETLSRESYAEAEPGGNFLSTAHTMRHFSTANFEPAIAEAGPFERWTENGQADLECRASPVWRRMLDTYEAPSMELSVNEALRDFVTRRKAGVTDAWY